MLQQILVGIVVLGAAAFVVRRIVDAVRPKADPPGCDACAMHESIDPAQDFYFTLTSVRSRMSRDDAPTMIARVPVATTQRCSAVDQYESASRLM